MARRRGSSLYNNPTIALDQVNGDEFVQIADRSALGARGQIRNDLDITRYRAT